MINYINALRIQTHFTKESKEDKRLKVLSFTVLTTFLDPPYPPSKKTTTTTKNKTEQKKQLQYRSTV